MRDIQPFQIKDHHMPTAEYYCISLTHFDSLSFEFNSKQAQRRPENSTQSPQMAARRRRKGAANRQRHTNSTERAAYYPKCKAPATLEGSFKEHTLVHSHKKVRPHMHTQLHKSISALFAKAETGIIKILKCHLKTSVRKNGMHSRNCFWGSNGTGNLFHDCSFVVYLSEFILREDTAF